MADPQVNFFKSTLVGTYSDTDTSITIATGDGALLPDPSVDGAFNLTIFEGLQVTGSTEFEIVRVTARSGDVLTVTRGQESTTPLTIGSATHSILMSATKKTFDDINTAIENVDLTTLTGVEELTFDSTGDEEFGLPAGTTAQRPSSPSAGYMRFNTDTKKLEVHNGGIWGIVSFDNVLDLQTAQLSVTANDAVAFEVPPLEVEYLVIAGGGGGNTGQFGWSGGGGGAGGYRSSVDGESSGGGSSAESALELDLSTNYTLTVGAGGAGSDGNTAISGSDSVFDSITSVAGGGAGGVNDIGNSTPASSTGGSTGGTFASSNTTTATANQGFKGGSGNGSGTSSNRSGGGGGAGEVGQNAVGSVAGDGGDGVQSSINGVATYRAGGGGGGGTTTNGGLGGGGNGASSSTPESGTVNTGGGGGGRRASGTGGSGGSGVVILRYPSSYTITIGSGLTGSETTVGANKVATITAGTGNVSWS